MRGICGVNRMQRFEMVKPDSSEIGAGTFSLRVSLIDFKQFQNDDLLGFKASSLSFNVFLFVKFSLLCV